MKLLNNKYNTHILLSLMCLLCLLPISAFATKMKAPAQISVQSNTTGNLVEVMIAIKLTHPVEKISVFVFNKGIEQTPEFLMPLPSKQQDEQQYRFVFNKDLYPNMHRLPVGIDFFQKNLKINESFVVNIRTVDLVKKNPQVVHPKNGEATEVFIP